MTLPETHETAQRPGPDAAEPAAQARGAEADRPALARLFSSLFSRLFSRKRLIRVALHVACWIPFAATVADSWRGPWRAIGDGARTGLVSWGTLVTGIPLVGQPNELPHTPHDLGPLQFWLLSIPVHIDTDRGVLWGAALLAMLAASLTIEAAYSVRGEAGGLLASVVVVATVAWFPGFAAWPFDTPNYGMMFFLAAISACLAVLSRHRNWWPVLVITASIAAQAHLTYAAASVGLVFNALVTALIDRFRAKGGYSWLIVGLIAGTACWIAPLDQQFFGRAGTKNISLLLHDDTGPHVGFAFAMKVMASLAAPSSLWWSENISQKPNLYQLLSSKPAAFGFVILAIAAASLVISVCWLRSRELAGLAAISLLVSVAAAATFARIPVQAHAIGGVHRTFGDLPLIFVMFIAVLLPWLTAICVTVIATARLISNRRSRAAPAGEPEPAEEREPSGQQRVRRHPILPSVRGAATLLVVLTALLLLGVRPMANYPGSGPNSLRVSVALAMIEPSLPKYQLISLTVLSPLKSDRYQVKFGLEWALTADGYQFNTTRSSFKRTISDIAVMIGKRTVTVSVRQKTCRPVPDTISMPSLLCAPGA